MLLAGLVAAGCRSSALTVYEENDFFSPLGERDRYYTQGLKASLVAPPQDTPELAREVASRLPLYDEASTTQFGGVFGQSVFTPRDTSLPNPDPKDRPYAGWLYVGVVVANQHLLTDGRQGDDQESLDVDVGVIGPPSLAETVTTRYHRLIQVGKSKGWSHQLHTEPGFVVAYERRNRLLARGEPGGLGFDLLPGYAGAVGNVDTHVAAHAMLRAGINLPRDFGVNAISTTAMETTTQSRGREPSLYAFGGAEGRGVIRNITLDGNTFVDSRSVNKTFTVGEFRAGLAFQYGVLRLTYAWVTRSSEFTYQHQWTKYGSLSLSVLIDF